MSRLRRWLAERWDRYWTERLMRALDRDPFIGRDYARPNREDGG